MGTLKLYKNCSDLPVRRFFDVVESGDLRYLIKTDDIEELECPIEAPDVWESIVDEYTSLSNNYQYTAQLNKQSTMLKEVNKVNTILAAIQLLKYGSTVADDALEYFGIKFETIDELKKIIKQLSNKKQRLEIRKGELDKAKGGKTDFYKVLAQVEKQLSRSIDIEKTSVKHWCAIINDLKDGNDKEK